jgi:hypothetical protein
MRCPNPNCQSRNARGAQFCSRCGTELPAVGARGDGWGWLILFGSLALSLVLSVVLFKHIGLFGALLLIGFGGGIFTWGRRFGDADARR